MGHTQISQFLQTCLVIQIRRKSPYNLHCTVESESECPRKVVGYSDNDLFYVYFQTAVMTSRSIVEVSYVDNYNFFVENTLHVFNSIHIIAVKSKVS